MHGRRHRVQGSRAPRQRPLVGVLGVPLLAWARSATRIPPSLANATPRSAAWLRWIAFLLLGSVLAGCGPEPQAPSPTRNPHPHKVSHLKITVEPGSGVNQVDVYSIWTIGNIGCAPHMWPSGASITKQVEVKEKVQKVDGYYLSTIRDDYFLPGKCKWNTDSYDVKFMHYSTLLGLAGGGPDDFDVSRVLKLTCVPTEPRPFSPMCFMRNREHFMRSHFSGVYNATLEIEP